MSLGTTVHRLRKSRGWTRRELQQRSGVHQNTIVDIELEKSLDPGTSKVLALARAFGVSVDELCDVTQPETRTA